MKKLSKKNKKTSKLIVPQNVGTVRIGDVYTFVMPATLPNGTRILVYVARLLYGPWKPEEDIKSITIHFQEK